MVSPRVRHLPSDRPARISPILRLTCQGLAVPATTGQKPYFFGYLATGTSIGVSLMRAKGALLADYGSGQDNLDVVNSYTILGDPA
jgi:hypothetical protein